LSGLPQHEVQGCVGRAKSRRFGGAKSRGVSVGELASDLLVLGLGNPLRGDDGIGPRVVEQLKQRGLPMGVEALDAGVAGFDLLYLLAESRAGGGDGPQRVIIVDAADVGLEAGQFARFTPEQVKLTGAAEGAGSHEAGLAETLALARALERPLPEIVVFGVQPGSLEWGAGLTAEVEAAVPLLVRAVLREIQDRPGQGTLQE
jgi:hydrogenase maturation protease